VKDRAPPDEALLALNTATVREQWTLREAIDGCARHRIGGIAPWRDQLVEHGAKDAAKRIRDQGLVVTGLCRGGMFTAADRKGRQAALDDNRRAVDDAAILEARCLVLVVGGLPPGSKDLAGAREMVRDGIGEVLEHARSVGVPLALEPLHPMYAAERGCVNTMAQANDLCDELGAGLGVAVDVYHVWWDAQLARQIERAGDRRLLAFHLSDWRVPTRDLLTDRAMMGDGVIDLPLIRSWMEAAGYRGAHEVELFSREWWRRDADEVLSLARERHQLYC
jgi:sugar phosphate isomerase/epimerase